MSGGLAATAVDLSTTTNIGETGEPVCDPDDADIPRSVWYKLTPTQAGHLSVTVTPATNAVDPTLALFTGTALNNLTSVVCQAERSVLLQ